ncbi:hypothetical protein ND991_03680 [Gordonia sputi]|uniref:hypothetical protein n=1 Tax=Gordonia sputi TaxID=36823 RepID=UPI0020443645|nr:hypothetical protein [Gordonia sputi]MCM3894320.1 hypothetical protein [Gordonia sputi]
MNTDNEAPAGKNAGDEIFASLVVLANSVGEEFTYSVTVVVQGTVISGRLVSGLTYAKWLAESDSFFDSVRDHYATAVNPDAREISDEELRTVTYFHLKDAVIYQGGSKIGLDYWRGLIASVDGWSVGRLDGDDEVTAARGQTNG